MARGRVLVDGFHRWQAHKKENATQIEAIDLGNLTEIEILKEAIQRNAAHGHQLSRSDKQKMAGELYDKGIRDETEMAAILSVSERALRYWLSEPKQRERDNKKALAWGMWLDCHSERDIAEKVGVTHPTVSAWVEEIWQSCRILPATPRDQRQALGTVQHFDVWSFANSGTDSSYFGKMPPAVVENLLWFYTEPFDIVVDPFAGGGTTIDAAKAMGRRVWASDGARTGWRSDRGTLRSVWSVSKLRTHTAVTLALIGRGAQVREQIAEAKPAVKPAARARHQHARSEQYTHSSRPQIHDGNVNGAGEAAVRKHYTAAAATMIAEHLGDKRSKFLTLADKAGAAEIINLVRGAVQLAATRDAFAEPATTPLRTNRHCRSCWHLVSNRRRHLRSKRRRWSDTSGHGDARQGEREGAALHCVTAAFREAPSTAPAALQQLTGAEAVAGAVVAGLSNRGPRSIVSAGYEAKRSRRN